MSEKLRDGWHLDKRVNLSIIFFVVAQSILATWAVSDVFNRVGDNTTRIAEIKIDQDRLKSQGVSQGNQLSGIKTEIIGLRRDIGRLLDRLDGKR